MHKFILTIRHDGGKIKITTVAQNIDAAKKIVMAAENCPERAILDVRSVNSAGFELATVGPRAGELIILDIAAPSVIRTVSTPRTYSKTGYGAKIPTDLKVRTIDEKWRRVYARCYSNTESLYVVHDGVKTLITVPHGA